MDVLKINDDWWWCMMTKCHLYKFYVLVFITFNSLLVSYLYKMLLLLQTSCFFCISVSATTFGKQIPSNLLKSSKSCAPDVDITTAQSTPPILLRLVNIQFRADGPDETPGSQCIQGPSVVEFNILKLFLWPQLFLVFNRWISWLSEKRF